MLMTKYFRGWEPIILSMSALYWVLSKVRARACLTRRQWAKEVLQGLIPLIAFAILYTRSSGVAYFGLCSLVCALSAKGLKRILRQPRPLREDSSENIFGFVITYLIRGAPWSALLILRKNPECRPLILRPWRILHRT